MYMGLLLYDYPLYVYDSYLNIYVGMIPQCTEKYYKFALVCKVWKTPMNVIATNVSACCRNVYILLVQKQDSFTYRMELRMYNFYINSLLVDLLF